MVNELLDRAEKDALLAQLDEAKTLGLLGPGPVEAHLDHAFHYSRRHASAPNHALDMGSGGGVPGLVLALVWPLSRWTLLDARDRSVRFLETATSRLAIADRVSIVHGRAEEAARMSDHRQKYDLVVARGFGPPAVTAECAAGFLEAGGALLVSEPPAELQRWPPTGLQELGMVREKSDENVRIAVLRQTNPCSERFPRRTGVPTKRPLF